jgi:hypothetical protein
MSSIDPSALRWRKSSYSASGNCIEVRTQDESVLIRDSKHRSDAILSFSSLAWREFIQTIQCSSTS